jgi:uncharacterized membrane protein YeaQ/YmgE (transglycosylase-associated protein family)
MAAKGLLTPNAEIRKHGYILPATLRRTLGFSADLLIRRISMHWLWEVLIGLVVGALAKLIMPGKDPGGFIVTILLGIAGSVVATWLGQAIGWYQEGQSAGFIMSLLGAVLLLAIYHAVRRRSA